MKSASNAIRLVPLLLFFLIFILVFVLIEIQVVFLLFVFLLLTRFLELQRIEATHIKVSATLFTGQRVAFVQFILIHVDYGVTAWTVDHLFPPETHFPYTRIRGLRLRFGLFTVFRRRFANRT